MDGRDEDEGRAWFAQLSRELEQATLDDLKSWNLEAENFSFKRVRCQLGSREAEDLVRSALEVIDDLAAGAEEERADRLTRIEETLSRGMPQHP